jgi:hypothetical protein
MLSIAALLLASLLIGLAHVASLPPLEDIDETAHYSRLFFPDGFLKWRASETTV